MCDLNHGSQTLLTDMLEVLDSVPLNVINRFCRQGAKYRIKRGSSTDTARHSGG